MMQPEICWECNQCADACTLYIKTIPRLCVHTRYKHAEWSKQPDLKRDDATRKAADSICKELMAENKRLAKCYHSLLVLSGKEEGMPCGESDMMTVQCNRLRDAEKRIKELEKTTQGEVK